MQAQTVANFYLAFEQNLAILPVLNKCDMPSAEPDRVAEQMQQASIPLTPAPYFVYERRHKLQALHYTCMQRLSASLRNWPQ